MNYSPTPWTEAAGVVGQATDSLSNTILRLAQMKQQQKQYNQQLALQQQDYQIRQATLANQVANSRSLQAYREKQAASTEDYRSSEREHWMRQDENQQAGLLQRLQGAQALLKLRQEMGAQQHALSQARIELARQKAASAGQVTPYQAANLQMNPLFSQLQPSAQTMTSNVLNRAAAPQMQPSYGPMPTNAPPQAPAPQMTNTLRLQAMQAIQAGKDPIAVRQRYQQLSGAQPDF